MKKRRYHKRMDQRMFDFKDYYAEIAEYLPERSVIAEIGVADGVSSIFLAETLLNLKKKFKFYMIDSLAYGGPDQLNTIVQHIGNAGLGALVEIVAVDSLNASCRFPDNHFDFVFIDASHKFEFTKADIRLWYQKIKEGGVLAGHDYNEQEGLEVKRAVDLVIPTTVTRAPLADGQVFEPEPVLHIVETAREYGVWWLQKRFYLRMN